MTDDGICWFEVIGQPWETRAGRVYAVGERLSSQQLIDDLGDYHGHETMRVAPAYGLLRWLPDLDGLTEGQVLAADLARLETLVRVQQGGPPRRVSRGQVAVTPGAPLPWREIVPRLVRRRPRRPGGRRKGSTAIPGKDQAWQLARAYVIVLRRAGGDAVKVTQTNVASEMATGLHRDTLFRPDRYGLPWPIDEAFIIEHCPIVRKLGLLPIVAARDDDPVWFAFLRDHGPSELEDPGD